MNARESEAFFRWPDAAALLLGAGISLAAMWGTLRTSQSLAGVDRDLFWMIVLVLAPGGVAIAGTARLAWIRPGRTWSVGHWLWPATALVGLAWMQVWLEAGFYLGQAGKLFGGPTAVLLSPLLGVTAATAAAIGLWKRSGRDGWHWGGIGLGLITGCGWLAFLAVTGVFG